jgi:hypothetical protein
MKTMTSCPHSYPQGVDRTASRFIVARREFLDGDLMAPAAGMDQEPTRHPHFVVWLVRGRPTRKRHWQKLTGFGETGHPFGNIARDFSASRPKSVTVVAAVNWKCRWGGV